MQAAAHGVPLDAYELELSPRQVLVGFIFKVVVRCGCYYGWGRDMIRSIERAVAGT